MITARDFRPVRIQVTLFTPALSFHPPTVFRWLVSEYGEEFDGESFLAPEKVVEAISVPKIFLQNASQTKKLRAGQDRIDIHVESEFPEGDKLTSTMSWAVGLCLKYLKRQNATAGRVAFVLNRIAEFEQPAKCLARHFCKPEWIDGPLNRPADFHLQSHKVFDLEGLFPVNSWVKFSCARLFRENESSGPYDIIVAEQDINSLADDQDLRQMTESEIRCFFETALHEMSHILDLYFPG